METSEKKLDASPEKHDDPVVLRGLREVSNDDGEVTDETLPFEVLTPGIRGDPEVERKSSASMLHNVQFNFGYSPYSYDHIGIRQIWRSTDGVGWLLRGEQYSGWLTEAFCPASSPALDRCDYQGDVICKLLSLTKRRGCVLCW